jgi:hypothetical protein
MNPVPLARRRGRSRLWRVAVATTAVGAAFGAALAGAGSAQASSHREAPLISGDPRADNTDVYAFVAPDAKNDVTLVANFIPFEEPAGGPNFYPFEEGSNYDFNIDSNGDAKADVIFRYTFKNVDLRANKSFLYNDGVVTSLNDKNLLFKQTYTLTRISGKKQTLLAKGTVAPSDVGKASMPKYSDLRDQAIVKIKGGGKSFAGQADDPFFADLRVFDLLYGGDLSETGTDTLKGYNVNTIALQVSKDDVALKANAYKNPVIGVWSSVEKQSLSYDKYGKAKRSKNLNQVSRLGNPLVNEVVLPAGLKDAFNSITPDKDAKIPEVVKAVTEPELPKLIEGIFKIKAPKTPRNDLVEIFLTGIAKKAPTLDGSKAPIQADLNSQVLNKDVNAKKFVPSEMLRLNLGVAPTAKPNRLGVLGGDLQGFPNGRRLADDVIDISLQAVEGAAQAGKLVDALAAGDKVNANEVGFENSFPYVALPHDAAVNTAGDGKAAAKPAAKAPAKAAGKGKAVAKGKSSVKAESLNLSPVAAVTSSGSSMFFFGAVLLILLSAVVLVVRRRRETSES